MSKYIYCGTCSNAWLNHKPYVGKCCHGDDAFINFKGVNIVENFVSEAEELDLVFKMDKSPWIDSQSGRRKQVNVLFYLLINNHFAKHL